MVAAVGKIGLRHAPRPGQSFARPTHTVIGNELPPDTGLWPSTYYSEEDKRGPSPASPGYVIGGTAGGGNDGIWGTDPRAPYVAPFPRRVAPVVEGQSSDGASGPPLGFAEGAVDVEAPSGWGRGWAARLGRGQDPSTHGRQSYWRGGIQGFNDKLTVKDRHAFWDTGHQVQGTDFTPASSPPNTYNNPKQAPPRPDLRTLNRTVSYQKGTDNTRNQDDLARPYTWLGEQGSGYSPVWGGVPGLFIPYGSRGGVPYPVVDPTAGQGGRETVWAGPPHGYHSLTYPDTADTLSRYTALPQMRPVRVDRPSNSPQAGQSFSQTVQHQGSPPRSAQTAAGASPVHHQGRGWAGQ